MREKCSGWRLSRFSPGASRSLLLPTLKTIAWGNKTTHGRMFDLEVQLLSAVSIAGFLVEPASPPASVAWILQFQTLTDAGNATKSLD